MFDFSTITLENAALLITVTLGIQQMLEFLLTRSVPSILRLFRGLWRYLKRRFKPGRYRARRILLNLSGHPLSTHPERAKAACKVLGWHVEDTSIIDVPIPTIAQDKSFLKQAARLLERVDLTQEEWQTVPLLVVPPGYAPLCAVLLAELHGRMGFFPHMARFHQEEGMWVLVDDVVNLQTVRTENRSKRYRTGLQGSPRIASPPSTPPSSIPPPSTPPVTSNPGLHNEATGHGKGESAED